LFLCFHNNYPDIILHKCFHRGKMDNNSWYNWINILHSQDMIHGIVYILKSNHLHNSKGHNLQHTHHLLVSMFFLYNFHNRDFLFRYNLHMDLNIIHSFHFHLGSIHLDIIADIHFHEDNNLLYNHHNNHIHHMNIHYRSHNRVNILVLGHLHKLNHLNMDLYNNYLLSMWIHMLCIHHH